MFVTFRTKCQGELLLMPICLCVFVLKERAFVGACGGVVWVCVVCCVCLCVFLFHDYFVFTIVSLRGWILFSCKPFALCWVDSACLFVCFFHLFPTSNYPRHVIFTVFVFVGSSNRTFLPTGKYYYFVLMRKSCVRIQSSERKCKLNFNPLIECPDIQS